MKLLIVDDEELTRTGVISSIDWKSLDIDEVLQADDGINGLEAARIHKPEIILCDVRMPRMDGITMLEKLEQFLPDTVPIFMSGYSDKEYLKAAIKLKAVNYIEKPLNPTEIREAVQEASEVYRQKLRTHRGETLHSMETASRLALALATPYRFSEKVISELSQELSLYMDYISCQYQAYHKFYITAGGSFTGVSKAYQSYESAVILQQSSFFFPSGSFLSSSLLKDRDLRSHPPLPEFPEKEFQDLLALKNQDGCNAFLGQIYDFYNQNTQILPNHAKDLYYKLFRCLDEIYRQLQISLPSDRENAVDTLENSFSFQDLHSKLLDRITDFFRELQDSVQENQTIFLIKEYISKNYGNESLSVKDISSHVFLSASYVCTFFKNETGKTLNQYLTEYRMEKAKQLLADPRFRIADISSKVGYNDGNYFGKSFKKYTGFSPSEYRERISCKQL